jgi:hypothetical protein
MFICTWTSRIGFPLESTPPVQWNIVVMLSVLIILDNIFGTNLLFPDPLLSPDPEEIRRV